ncbi:MAG: hypothetical protein H6610_04325 [Ignavibacteriales bacterium]|nr:hypothetical protein [Ignavibacteriales bacterium]MCB9218672.1 hypothetical protein [Ignavibacteriales bacterium]MCB9259322.1 hypothetical protein [Ignavibacteriales bacterium]
MVLDLLVTKTDDGVTAEIPSIKGCECWAHKEDEAIDKSIELLRFYNNLDSDVEIKIDKARGTKTKIIYKLVFNKDLP